MHISTQCWVILLIQSIFLAIIIQVTTANLNPAVAPRNQVTTVGRSVTFSCQQTASGPGVAWLFYNLESVSYCTIYYYPSGGITCPDITRYSTTNAGGYFNLTISSVQFSDAGTYGCWDQEPGVSNSGTQTAVFGVIDSTLTEKSNSTCALQGQSVSYTCRVQYNGSNLMPPSVNWTTSSGHIIVGSVSNYSSGWFESSLTVTANTPTILQCNCTLFFQQPTGNTVNGSTNIQATNSPSYTNTNSSSSTTVRSCSGTIVITYNGTEFINGSSITEGDTLTCINTGITAGDSALYQWTDSTTGLVISNGPTVVIGKGSFTYTCSAMTSCDQINYPCAISKSATGYATAAPTTTAAITTTAIAQQSTSGSSPTSSDTSSMVTSEVTQSHPSVATATDHSDDRSIDSDNTSTILIAVLIPCGVIIIVIIIIALCRPCSFCCQCWHSTSDHCCSKCKPTKEKNYHQNKSDDSSDLTPEQCHTNPTFNTSNNYPMSSARSPPDLIHPHQGDSRPYQPNNQSSDPVYADLTENKPGSRKPVAMHSDTVYAPIDRA